jgi:hypothetical protein
VCSQCGERVYRIGGRTLSAVRVAGGLFELDGNGVRRRPLGDCAAEYRHRRRVYGGGYEPHECPQEPHWAAR